MRGYTFRTSKQHPRLFYFGGLSATIPSWQMSFVRKHVSVVPVNMVKMKRQRTMFSFVSVSDGKKSRMETVTGKSNFRCKQISNMQAARNKPGGGGGYSNNF